MSLHFHNFLLIPNVYMVLTCLKIETSPQSAVFCFLKNPKPEFWKIGPSLPFIYLCKIEFAGIQKLVYPLTAWFEWVHAKSIRNHLGHFFFVYKFSKILFWVMVPKVRKKRTLIYMLRLLKTDFCTAENYYLLLQII